MFCFPDSIQHVEICPCFSNSGPCVHPFCGRWYDLLNKLPSVYKIGCGLKTFPSLPLKLSKVSVRDINLTSTHLFIISINKIWLPISQCGVSTCTTTLPDTLSCLGCFGLSRQLRGPCHSCCCCCQDQQILKRRGFFIHLPQNEP